MDQVSEGVFYKDCKLWTSAFKILVMNANSFGPSICTSLFPSGFNQLLFFAFCKINSLQADLNFCRFARNTMEGEGRESLSIYSHFWVLLDRENTADGWRNCSCNNEIFCQTGQFRRGEEQRISVAIFHCTNSVRAGQIKRALIAALSSSPLITS